MNKLEPYIECAEKWCKTEIPDDGREYCALHKPFIPDPNMPKGFMEDENKSPFHSEPQLQMLGILPHESKEAFEERKREFKPLKDYFGFVHNEGGPIPKDIKIDYSGMPDMIVPPLWQPNSIDYIALAKPNYLSKDGTIKKGIEMDGLFYAPKNDLPT